MLGREPGQFALVEVRLVVHFAALELFGPHGHHLGDDGTTGALFWVFRSVRCPPRLVAAIFVYLTECIDKLFAGGLGFGGRNREVLRSRRRRRGRFDALLRRLTGGGGGGLQRGWPHRARQFLRPRVELLGGRQLLLLLRRRGGRPPEELFFLFEAFLDPGHDDGIIGLRTVVVLLLLLVMMMMMVVVVVVMRKFAGRRRHGVGHLLLME